MAIKKNIEKSFSVLSWLFHLFLGGAVIAGALLFASSKGIEMPNLIKGIRNADFSQILNAAPASTQKTDQYTSNDFNDTTITYVPLEFTGELQLFLGEYDNYGRSTYAHIQLRDRDEPAAGSRESKITFDPVGWHNYKFEFLSDDNKIEKAWLMNRGHLVGYQFSGLNSEGRNLVPQTRYLNAGTMSDNKMDDKNYNSQLFYENQLDSWLALNKEYTLDLMVVPNYKDSELLPRTVTMYWTGFDRSGKQIEVDLGEKGLSTTSSLVSTVTLNNTSPNATINYSDGTAIQK